MEDRGRGLGNRGAAAGCQQGAGAFTRTQALPQNWFPLPTACACSCGCVLIDIVNYDEYLAAFAPLWPSVRAVPAAAAAVPPLLCGPLAAIALRPAPLPSAEPSPRAACTLVTDSINQSITFKVHGEPAEVSWDWAGGEGCVSGVHSIGRGTVRCGRRLAGPARPVGWRSRAGLSLRSGCGGWCRGGIEKGSVPHLLWEQGDGGSAGHVRVGQWLPRGRWGRSDRGRRMWQCHDMSQESQRRRGLPMGHLWVPQERQGLWWWSWFSAVFWQREVCSASQWLLQRMWTMALRCLWGIDGSER